MQVFPNKCYYHKNGVIACVRKVIDIVDGRVNYIALHGPVVKKGFSNRFQTSLRGFKRWAQKEIEELDDYRHLDGATIHPTFIVLDTKSNVIFRCSQKRAKFYLKKGYANLVNSDTIQLTNDVTEKRLSQLYDGEFSEFFTEIKNDHCVVCGCTGRLTRHHVVPQRHVGKIPFPWRNCISNVLFVCMDCHLVYESNIDDEPQLSLGDPFAFARAWKEHFIKIMQPKFMPKGWDIVSVKNVELLDGPNIR